MNAARDRARRWPWPVKSLIHCLALVGSMAMPAVASAEGPRWNGPYIGVGAGFGMFNSHTSYTSASGASLFVDDGWAGAGLLATIYGGYDVRLGHAFVAGVTADFDWSSLELLNSERFLYTADTWRRLTGEWALGGRIGYLVAPDVLWYFAAGYTQTNFEDRRRSTVVATQYGRSHTAGGIYLGIGAEAQLGSGLALRTEYRVSDLEQELAYWNPAHTIRIDAATSVQTARIGLAWRPGETGASAGTDERAPIWTGAYLGAGGGGGIFKQNQRLRRTAAPVGINDWDGLGGDGLLGSLIAGADWRVLPGIVGGAFVDLDRTGMEYRYISPPAGRGQFTLDTMWSVGARLGYLASPSTLLFATAGYAQADFSSYHRLGSASYDIGSFGGAFAGGGMETMLTSSIGIRGEMRWVELEERFIRASGVGVDQYFRPSVQTGRLMLVYRIE